MPKKPMATAQDVTDLKAEMVQEIETAKQATFQAIEAAKTKLAAQIGGLDGKLNDHMNQVNSQAIEQCRRDAASYTDSQRVGLKEELKLDLDSVRDRCKEVDSDLTKKLADAEDGLKQLMGQLLDGLSAKFDNSLLDLKNEMNDNMQIWAKEAADALVEQQNQLRQEIDDLCKKAEADDIKQGEIATEGLRKAMEEQQERDLKQDERRDRANAEIYGKISKLDEKLEEQIAKLREETSNTHESHVAKHEEHVGQTEKNIATLYEDTNSLRNAMSEVENMSTRRVDWVIKNVSKRIRPLSPSRSMLHTSWFSPKFDAAGAYGMQLELQLFRNSDPPVDGEDAGDVAIHLWACKGMQLAYKLSCGSKSVVLSKTFNGRVPYGTKRFCFVRDEINRADDTLKVSVEFLEAIREIEHVIKPPPEPIVDPNAPPKTLEELQLEQQKKEKALEGSMFFMRTINNRLYDQVKQQVHILQSRMVRKVEWRVENASLLRQCFPPDECICSTAFAAAGVDGMQFIFYPSGYKASTEGYCSLFLFGPAGATLKCWLSAGGQKRDASNTFNEPGAFGRTNFARFESCVNEAEDSILIALEIEDAQQDLVAHVKHPAVQPGDQRTLQQIEGSSDKAIESVVKLTKRPGQRAFGKDADLVELRVLPSLWTAKQLGTTNPPPEGMRNMDDIKVHARNNTRQGGNLSAGSGFTLQNSAMMRSSSSLPTMSPLRDTNPRPAMEEDLMASPPGSRKVEGRRTRPRQNLGASLTALT